MGRFHIAFPFLIACICYASMGLSFTCKEAERNALLKFKHSFTTDGANQLGSWVGQNCCSWKGVGCDNVTGNVIKLALNGGSSRYSASYLEAREVNPALLELKYLTYLDLSFINFNGCSFPEFIGSMRELRYLNLSSNTFQGKVPHNLGNLTKLVVLDIENWHDVDLLGYWWSMKMETNLEWVVKLENLQYLDLSGIDLSQALDSTPKLLHKLPSLLVLNLAHCTLENSHLFIRNSTVSSSPLQHLDLGYNSFSGPIPYFIQNLSSISFLDLSFNYLNSSIPAWLGSKRDLKFLSLGNNSFGGSFPHFIQNLSFLTNLDLSNNQFISSIPSWLVNKRHLEYLDLSGNCFDRVDGGIMNIIGRLCSLKHLDLSHNQLQEEVLESHAHSFPRCSIYDLKSLYMANNNMSGQLPTVESLLSLQELDLSHNNFEIIPTSFGELSSLESVDLSYNHLSIVTQASLANLSSLLNLDMSSNSLILDLSPDWMPPFQLSLLSILPCKLNSPFPKWLLSQKLISVLDLSDTGMFGPLPDNIGNEMPSLWSIRLANNHINGSIPRSLCGSTFLGSLDLQNNTLSGIIPDCWANSTIVDMELSSNKLSGPIPHSLTKIASLYLLSLNNNSLEGELPLSLSNCAKLTVLDVGRNNLHGEIPPWINGSNFPSLKVLILRENRFKGRIPLQLCSFPVLQVIDLGRNNLIGTIPQCFGSFKGMGFVQHSSDLNASPPSPIGSDITSEFASGPTMVPDEWSAVELIKGKEREYTTIVLRLLVNMDLSCNNLVGVIPADISNLTRLYGLNLSHNHFKGTIPKEMGKMISLESLDLSFNNLSGLIPESISSLDTLSTMNLSFNNLHGQIPTGRHFQTLDDPSIYMGNPGLCGDPLPKCSGGTHPPTSTVLEDEEEEDKHEKMWFYLVIMLGFATGFWGVIGVLVFKKRWRVAYFQLAEELVDWLYVRVKVRIARAE